MKLKSKKDQLKNLINLYIRMMEEGYKFRIGVWKKKKYNIAQNESISNQILHNLYYIDDY